MTSPYASDPTAPAVTDADLTCREAGFTLVEVTAALAILALSLSVLFSLIGNGLRQTGQAGRIAEASSLAQSLLARLDADLSLKEGETAGEFVGGYQWRVRVAPYGDPADRAHWSAEAYDVTAEVQWNDGQDRTVALTTLRVGAREPRR